jgi:AGZA family xanthine/uracil permease-like MFS transporter
LLAIVGVAVAAFFMARKSPFAFLISIAIVTLAAWALGMVTRPPELFSLPDFKSVFLKLEIFGALKLSLVPAIIAGDVHGSV